jgi:hypothetical protein
MKSSLILTSSLFIAGIAGCAGRTSFVPNIDPRLRKSSTEFAAEAVKHFPYPANAPRGGDAQARAVIGYMLDRIDIENLSDEDWSDVDVWVNQQYVVHVPVMEKNLLKRLDFQMIYNDAGQYFPTDNSKTLVNKVEILRGGKMYDVKPQLGD